MENLKNGMPHLAAILLAGALLLSNGQVFAVGHEENEGLGYGQIRSLAVPLQDLQEWIRGIAARPRQRECRRGAVRRC